jgi:hypothetical protein
MYPGGYGFWVAVNLFYSYASKACRIWTLSITQFMYRSTQIEECWSNNSCMVLNDISVAAANHHLQQGKKPLHYSDTIGNHNSFHLSLILPCSG